MKTIAIVIGISSNSCFDKVPGASADADRFASALMSWGLPKEHIYLLKDEQATKTNIVKTFYDCLPHFDTAARLIFYFAGHGLREKYLDQAMPESFLICHDTLPEEFMNTGFRLVELMQLFHILKPREAYLFIDACSLRLNEISNPLNDNNILSTSNAEGLFCLLSSGIYKSYEDANIPHGYFTSALLKSFGELRLSNQPNCHTLSRKVTALMKQQGLPLPEIYHVGSEDLWPLGNFSPEGGQKIHKTEEGLILRWEVLGQLQDRLVSSPTPLIWVWGEGGMGKTIVAEQLREKCTSSVYASIPAGANGIDILIEQIRLQKGELFFNRPAEKSLELVLIHLASKQPNTVFIMDHLDRLSRIEMEWVLSLIDKLPIPCVLISRYPCPVDSFIRRRTQVHEWMVPPLSLHELIEIGSLRGLDRSAAPILLNATKGNLLKVRQLLAALLDDEVIHDDQIRDEYVQSMQALAATGGFLDEELFCRTFKLKSKTLSKLEKLGLIRYTQHGCFPHDTLLEMVEENGWPLNFPKACHYWNKQVLSTPFNRAACRSLVLIASQQEDCAPLKKGLSQCLETLNEREYISFIKDLIKIFQKHQWEEILIRASDYLIDHEEYLLAGDVLQPLLTSKKQSIRYHACKNNARRMVWLGQFGEFIQSNFVILKKCRSLSVLIPLKNNIGIAHFFMGNLDTALKFFHDALKVREQTNIREVGVAKLMIGLIMTYRGENTARAKELLESSNQIFETTKYYLWNIVALNSLGDLSYRLNQWKQALYYVEKAITVAETLQNNTFLLFSQKNIVRVHLRLHGIDSFELSISVENLEMILSEVMETGHNWVTVWAYNVLATVYALRKDIHKLEEMIRVVSPLTEGYKECHIFTLSNIGHLAALKNDYSLAKRIYQQAYQLTEEVKNPFALQEIMIDFIASGLPRSLQPFNRL